MSRDIPMEILELVPHDGDDHPILYYVKVRREGFTIIKKDERWYIDGEEVK